MFTTLTPDAAQYDFIADLDRSLISKGIKGSYPDVMKKRWESLLPVSPLELEIDPCPLKVAIAVTASASFPPLVGPITFTVGDELDYWHTGDGGLYENLGLESLLFTFQKQMQDRKVRRALILAFNSSYPFSVGFKQLKQRSQPWTLFNYDFSRIPQVMEERATAYWSLFYRSLQIEGVFPDDSRLRVLFLNHESAQWADGLDTKLLINSDFGLMHVGALARWQKEGLFSYGGRLEEADNKFINRDCAMLLQSSGSIGSLKKSLTFDWGTGQLPHWGAPYPKANTTLGGATLWVMRGREPASYNGVAQFSSFVAESSQQSWWAATTGYLPITKAAVNGLEEQDFYKKNPEQWTGVSQLLNDQTARSNRGLRLGNYTQVRQAIEMELESIFSGKKTVKEGLDAAVLRGNAILRHFGVTHGAAGQGEI